MVLNEWKQVGVKVLNEMLVNFIVAPYILEISLIITPTNALLRVHYSTNHM
jgi:hypothetical protein